MWKHEEMSTDKANSVQRWSCYQRDYREGWSLLTVETEVNGDSKSTIERGPSLVGSLGSSCRYKRLFILPWLLWSAQKKYFFPYRTLFQPGQAVVQGRLSLNVCLRPQNPRTFRDLRQRGIRFALNISTNLGS